MKFAKLYIDHINEKQPGWSDKFLSYNELKRLIRLIPDGTAEAEFMCLLNDEIDKFKNFFINNEEEYIIRLKELEENNKKTIDLCERSGSQPSESDYKDIVDLHIPDGTAEAEFMCLLNNEIDKFNNFYIEKEEEYIIRLKELEENIKKTIDLCERNGSQPSESDYKDIVDLHGEMVLLINYCNINYTGLTKIREKYERKTGALLRLPFLQKILEQPFLSTEVISKLVRECENIIDDVSHAGESGEREKEEVVLHGRGLFKSTVEVLFTTPDNDSASAPN